jgi:protein-L-isoaspartate(D-aspartate) O-methyltransferase
VRFVPLVGAEGWAPEREAPVRAAPAPKFAQRKPELVEGDLAVAVANAAQAFDGVETADLTPLLDRIGEARIVLLGEATHGTSEFYTMRARISRELITRKGFRIIGIEGDWPDAARDHLIATSSFHPRNGPHSPAFPPGCGATTKCVRSSIG